MVRRTIIVQWILGIGVAVLVVVGDSAALATHGGGKCGERKAILEHLEWKYDEVVRYSAITGKGGLVEVAVGPEGSWSMLVTIPGGTTCLMSSGEDWQDKVVREGKGT